jgi:hypothetical protein
VGAAASNDILLGPASELRRKTRPVHPRGRDLEVTAAARTLEHAFGGFVAP